ncbi:uncharacterized protein LOC135167301 isoform X2 [Diachasmimorpha longicaudata]
MKHQRAALLAQTENAKKGHHADDPDMPENPDSPDKNIDSESGFEEVTVVGSLKSLSHEDDDDNEEFEYVVESLDAEEEDEEEEEPNDQNDMQVSQEEDAETSSLKLMSGDEGPTSKKIKLEPYPRRDALAEAMAHVHQDYLEQSEDHETVGLDMEVESETTILPDKDDDGVVSGDEGLEKSTVKRLHGEETSASPQGPQILAYKINSSDLAGINLQAGNTVTISTSNNKTVTLNAAKAVTLNASKLPGGGAQFVLSKVKGNLPALVMAGSKTGNHKLAPKRGLKKMSPGKSGVTVAGTSVQSAQEIQKIETQKLMELVKNPCISTHVLDTSKGTPVTGLQVSLYKLMDGRWTFLNESTTSGSGRCTDLVNTGKTAFTAGRYKMHFDVDKYFTLRRIETLYPFIEIVFDVKNPTGNYHIPVLLSPFGYTTYRGTDR